MSEERVTAIFDRVESHTAEISRLVSGGVYDLDVSLHGQLMLLRQETGVRIAAVEVKILSVEVLVVHDAEYHLLRAYFHASPSLILILTAIWGFITTVVEIINVINTVLKVITGETLAHWLDKIIPGFEQEWNNIMAKVSELSGALGWGVDGVNHLLNACDTGADLWGMVTGKDRSAVSIEKINHFQTLAHSYSIALSAAQENPGAWIANNAEYFSAMRYEEGAGFVRGITDKIESFSKKSEDIGKAVGSITGELLALRSDMPAFIAKNIPQAIWDGLGWADTMINDRLLPRLDALQEKLDSVNKLLDKYREDAAALADRLSKPGDLLAEIDKLPGYARAEQLGKIDSVTSTMLRESNEASFAEVEGDLREFGKVAQALSHAPPPLTFMELELPGRSPGIVAEPRETWFVGDY